MRQSHMPMPSVFVLARVQWSCGNQAKILLEHNKSDGQPFGSPIRGRLLCGALETEQLSTADAGQRVRAIDTRPLHIRKRSAIKIETAPHLPPDN